MAATLARYLAKKMFMDKSGKFSKMATGGTLMNGYFALQEYNDSRNEGGSVAGSLFSAASDLALGALVGPWKYMAATMLPSIATGSVDLYDAYNRYGRQLASQKRYKPFQNATFVDSQQTYTMRQAGMNLARQGQMAAQQTSLGNEASSISYMGR